MPKIGIYPYFLINTPPSLIKYLVLIYLMNYLYIKETKSLDLR